MQRNRDSTEVHRLHAQQHSRGEPLRHLPRVPVPLTCGPVRATRPIGRAAAHAAGQRRCVQPPVWSRRWWCSAAVQSDRRLPGPSAHPLDAGAARTPRVARYARVAGSEAQESPDAHTAHGDVNPCATALRGHRASLGFPHTRAPESRAGGAAHAVRRHSSAPAGTARRG